MTRVRPQSHRKQTKQTVEDITFYFNNLIYNMPKMDSVNTSRFLSSKPYLFFLQFATPFNVRNHEPNIIQNVIRKYINTCFRETRSVSYKDLLNILHYKSKM